MMKTSRANSRNGSRSGSRSGSLERVKADKGDKGDKVTADKVALPVIDSSSSSRKTSVDIKKPADDNKRYLTIPIIRLGGCYSSNSRFDT